MNREPTRAKTATRRSLIVPLTCSPPRRPADTASKHLVDLVLPTGAAERVYFVVVAALVIAAPFLPTRPGLAVGALAAVAGSVWCLANFWRCREAHCVITGAGWGGLFALQIVELGIGRSLIHGAESSAFVGILVIGLLFECCWQVAFGTNALTRDSTATRS